MPGSKLRPKERLHIACEDLDLSFSLYEVAYFQEAWNAGRDIRDIAQELERDPDELAILVIDQDRKGAVNKRPGGALGKSR